MYLVLPSSRFLYTNIYIFKLSVGEVNLLEDILKCDFFNRSNSSFQNAIIYHRLAYWVKLSYLKKICYYTFLL